MSRARLVEIVELADTWRVSSSAGVLEYPTAAEALEAVRAEDRARVDAAGGRAVSVVQWSPSSRVGVAVVLALTS